MKILVCAVCLTLISPISLQAGETPASAVTAARQLALAAMSPRDIFLTRPETGELVELEYLDVSRRWNESFQDWETVWQGEVAGEPGTLAIFTTIGGNTAGAVVLPDRILRVLPTGEVSEIPRTVSCGTTTPPFREEQPSAFDAFAKASPAPVEIVLALPFSPAARDKVGGAAAIRALLANQQNVLNAALARSGLGAITVKVVGIQRVDYFENDPQRSGLNYLSNRTKYFRNLRNGWKADIVVLTNTYVPGPAGGYAGLANQFTGDPTLGFGMVRIEYVEWALLHEVGHLLSATHEQGYFACPSGGQFLGKDFVTIMWTLGVPSACAPERLLQFSNPAVIYAPSGLPTGKSKTNDNASRVALAAPKVAQFKR